VYSVFAQAVGEAKKQFAAAGGGIAEKGKSTVGGVKKLFTG
jgi:hypothetical protein